MHAHMQTIPRRTGFTLIETLIVITLIAILATVVLPAARSAEVKSLESAARVLASDLRLARNLAVQYNTEWTIQFDVEDNAYELIHTGSGPALRPPNLLAGSTERSETYRVEWDRWGSTLAESGGLRWGSVTTRGTQQPVRSVSFGPQGGTGPVRNEDTVIWLSQGSAPDIRAIRLTVSWITGQVWIDPPKKFTREPTAPSL